MTDDTGMLQHAIFTIPNRREGHTTDDNARALISVHAGALETTGKDQRGKTGDACSDVMIPDFSARYLSFLEHAFNPAKGRFKNFLGYDRRWNEADGSEDCHGRALWALGTVLGRSSDQGLRCAAGRLFEFCFARSYGIQKSSCLGLYPARNSGSTSLRIPETATHRKLDPLLLGDCSICMSRSAARIGSGLRTFWLTATRDCPRPCCLSAQLARMIAWFPPASNHSTGLRKHNAAKPTATLCRSVRKASIARVVKRPASTNSRLEAAGAVSACLQAYRVTGDSRWRNEAWSAFNWFLGDNDLQLPLYDSVTGGCRDGLHPDRANENQGAESTLSFLMALLEMRRCKSPNQWKFHYDHPHRKTYEPPEYSLRTIASSASCQPDPDE